MSKVNVWTAKSLEWASQHDYLDKLFSVYPMHNNLKRSIPEYAVRQLETYFDEKNSGALVTLLLKQEIFPIKDSYVASLKRDPGALDRNPRTLARLAGMLYEMGFSNIIENVTAPKETNRQIGPLFKNWLEKGVLG